MVPDPGSAPVEGVPQTVAGPWDLNIFHISGDNSIIAAFDRAVMNNEYVKIINTGGNKDGGRLADVRVNKVQLHWLAAKERAITLRYMSPIRAAMHAANRRQGHGSDGGIYDDIRTYLVDSMAAGYDGGTGTTA